jgi:hypothetical protein
MSFFPNGYYDDNGNWRRSKFCFAYCGDACDCGPPDGQWHIDPEKMKIDIERFPEDPGQPGPRSELRL